MPQMISRPSVVRPGAEGPCAPRMERAHDYLAELRRLSPADLQAVVVLLEAALSTTTTSATDDFKAPGDSDLVIFGVQGFVRMPSLNTEPTTILGWLNLVPTERWLVKAQNCLAGLRNVDRKHKVFDGDVDVPLSAIMGPTGFPFIFPPEAPLIIPQSEVLQGTFTLQDTTAAIVGNATRYGLLLSGVLVPRRS